ncbi:MAG: MFS transporter [Candidatus Paceibacterota bacterium]|jgi:MFS family permease
MYARNSLTIANFFVAISSTLVSYTLLSYLSTFISGVNIGFAIAAGGVVAVVAFLFLPPLVMRYGPQQLALFVTFIEMVMLFAVAASPGTIASAILVILVLALQPVVYYQLDLLLEATVSNEGTTGRVRTFFLTGGNVGVLVAPLLIGALMASGENYTIIFMSAAAVLMPLVVLFAMRRLPQGETPERFPIRDTIRHIAHDRDLAAVTIGHFILYLFYIWAPLYIPVYLHSVLGIPWSTLGWMFSVMLLPYVIIEYPAGWVADRILGDKEMMLAGFIIAGSALAAVSLLTATSTPFIILSVLVATRVGAALVESMTEGHFFRRVSEKDIVSVSVFRGVWPLTDALAPLIGSAILIFGNYQLFFVVTGGFVLVTGVVSTLFIRDFR